ncbi:hypothetical protein [Corynebacterium sp. LaCa116]|uniref:hypothetical protein n=1 Tax=Corynebacterium sp. LaCa116 TaxID=3391423 RepID=UPI003989C8BC
MARTPPAHAHRTCAANILLHADILSTTVLELYIVNDTARVTVRARRRAAAADNPDARQADITNGEIYAFSVNGNDTEATAGEPGAPPRGPRTHRHEQCDKRRLTHLRTTTY